VEDHPLNAQLARDLLESAGHRVEIVSDGAAFRVALDGGVPDIVLMDIRLPDTDGVTLLHELRSRETMAQVPVIAVTAHAMTDELARLERAGFDGVLTKPIATRTFAADVGKWAAAGRQAGGRE
jgi:CheY-like chemotaxis protein